MQYELINPSDPYTFIADNKEVATLTVFCLSTWYGAESEDGSETVHVFMFGGSKEWFKKEFGKATDQSLEDNRTAVGKALSSMMYGHFEDRRRYEAALEAITDDAKREDFIKKWQDGISSLNDIGTYAHTLGKQFLEQEG